MAKVLSDRGWDDMAILNHIKENYLQQKTAEPTTQSVTPAQKTVDDNNADQPYFEIGQLPSPVFRLAVAVNNDKEQSV